MNLRAALLPLAALGAVLALLGVQLAFGGADYVPTPVADPCVERPLPAATNDLEQVTQTVVLAGVQRAACTLGVSRERLLLALPTAIDRTALIQETGHSEQELAAALKEGMTASVARLDGAGRIPPASSLLDTYIEELGLTGLAAQAAKQIPASVIDNLLPTGEVLQRAIDGVDVNALLENLNNPDALEPQLRAAIQAAAIAEAKQRLSEQLPAPLSSFLNLG